MNTIAITDIAGFKIGQVEDVAGATGVTAIIREQGMAAGIDVRGGGPASRDTRTLDPLAAAERIHAVLLAGGSAFGLDAAGGAMRYLEERGIGVEVGPAHVPIVCQSDIFDLLVGDPSARPDAEMGYAACANAETGNYRDGNYGAGCGATVGKACGPEFCMKSGIGSFAVQVGDVQVGAIVVVNAIGDVSDPASGKTVAGLLAEDGNSFRSTAEVLYDLAEKAAAAKSDVVTNTTIGAILTNANLTKAQLCKVAGMGHDGLARTIRPVHTSMDGDSLYALSTCEVEADTDLVGMLAADVVAQAILAAVRSAQDAYGLPCAETVAQRNE
ncbi:MAG: P1 family peptidase [Eggerthellaceae bacterium]|nr:P1 family peptidase [Eggerthellaceae bacterium]